MSVDSRRIDGRVGGGAGLVFQYVVQYSIGSWVHHTRAERCKGAQGLLLAIMGATIFILAFVEVYMAWYRPGRPQQARLVLVSICEPFFLSDTKIEGDHSLVVPVCMCISVMTVQRRFGGVQEDAMVEYMALLCQWWGI